MTQVLTLTAQDAFERYEDALHNGWLRQGTWNSEEDGRRVACALGVIDPQVDSASDCPATVMPKWLARVVPWLFDNQDKEDAFAWGEKFYAQLARLNGQVPFEVVYDWHARYSWPMGIEALAKMRRDTTAAEAIKVLHERAANGDRADRETWYRALKNFYSYVDAYADGYVKGDANAYANADAYVNVTAYAKADADGRKKAVAILANGLVECMTRVSA